MTQLLMIVEEKRTHRVKHDVEMMTQWESMIRNQNTISRTTSPETGRKHCTAEIEKDETVTAGSILEEKTKRIDHRYYVERSHWKNYSKISVDEENTGDWSESESDGHVFNGWRNEDKQKVKTFAKSQSMTKSRQQQQLKMIRPLRPCLSAKKYQSVSVSHAIEAKYRMRVQQFLSFTDEEKLTLVVDDEVDASIVQHLNTSYSEDRPMSDGEIPLVGLLFFHSHYGKLSVQKLARSWRILKSWRKRPPTRSRPNDVLWSTSLTYFRSLTIEARRPDQANAWYHKRLVPTPPFWSMWRVE